MEHTATQVKAVTELNLRDHVRSMGRDGWTLVSTSQSYPTEPLFMFWRKS